MFLVPLAPSPPPLLNIGIVGRPGPMKKDLSLPAQVPILKRRGRSRVPGTLNDDVTFQNY